jgi:SAM-dependent methyltransferase
MEVAYLNDEFSSVLSGNGEEVREIATLVGAGGRVIGIDLSATLVDEARSRTPVEAANVEFVVGDAHALPFEDGTFDAVRAERTVQHVDDPALVVSEMARVTRAGGRVAVTEPDWGLLFIAASDQETSVHVCERVATGSRNPRIGRNLALLFGQSAASGRDSLGRPSRGLWRRRKS